MIDAFAFAFAVAFGDNRGEARHRVAQYGAHSEDSKEGAVPGKTR